MKKQIAILGCFLLLLNACGKSDESTAQTEDDLVGFEIEETVGPSVSKDLLQVVARDSKDFRGEFKKFDAAQKYYFCAAFAMGAMSVAKPTTASAMVNYFIGMGVVQYKRGIDDDTYKAFDFGKNIFHFEPAVNMILREKICEKIIGDAVEGVKHQHIKTKEINKIGKQEVRKIVNYIKETR